MKKNIFVILFIIIILLSITALSQLAPIINIVNEKSQVTPTISLEENKTCIVSFYNEIKELYGNCIYYSNSTNCLNTSGPNTACSLSQNQWNFTCKQGEIVITNNRTECKPDNKFIITIDKGVAIAKKQIDFSNWGPCIYNMENNCLIVTCVSLYDGAHKGQFTDCNGGKSCQRFEICDNSIKTLYKNSREDFVYEDPTFHLSKLTLKEMGE